MSDNIPESAIKLRFEYGAGRRGEFYVWPVKGGSKWQWSALGNCGEARSREEAVSEARDYIIFDYNPESK